MDLSTNCKVTGMGFNSSKLKNSYTELKRRLTLAPKSNKTIFYGQATYDIGDDRDTKVLKFEWCGMLEDWAGLFSEIDFLGDVCFRFSFLCAQILQKLGIGRDLFDGI